MQAITPGWLDFHITSVDNDLRSGSLIKYRLRWHGVPLCWTTEIASWDPPHGFIDTQLSGPYALWRHEHRLTPENDGTRIRDEVTYALPFGILGQIMHQLFVRRDVEAIFDFRQRRLRELLGE